MKNKQGFTLIEILVSTSILLVAVAGFLAWTANVVNQRAGLSKRNNAYDIAVDVSDRLAKLSATNAFLLPNSSGIIKYVGLQSDGSLSTCPIGSPSPACNPFQIDPTTGLTPYTDPWNGSLLLYDNNQGTFSGGAQFAANGNSCIDHPNSSDNVTSINQIINPIRRLANGVTYYVIWSVAYEPCAAAPTDLVKIFITVYWIEPEPSPLTVTLVNSGISSGLLAVKNVSITIDKSLTAVQ